MTPRESNSMSVTRFNWMKVLLCCLSLRISFSMDSISFEMGNILQMNVKHPKRGQQGSSKGPNTLWDTCRKKKKSFFSFDRNITDSEKKKLFFVYRIWKIFLSCQTLFLHVREHAFRQVIKITETLARSQHTFKNMEFRLWNACEMLGCHRTFKYSSFYIL